MRYYVRYDSTGEIFAVGYGGKEVQKGPNLELVPEEHLDNFEGIEGRYNVNVSTGAFVELPVNERRPTMTERRLGKPFD